MGAELPAVRCELLDRAQHYGEPSPVRQQHPDELFAKVANGERDEAAQNAAHDNNKVTQKAAQHVREPVRTNAKTVPDNAGNTRDDAHLCASVQNGAGGNRTPVP
jgi:hypothetical protein